MVLFGEATFQLTGKLKQSVLVESEVDPGLLYQFRLRKRKVNGIESWSCTSCESRRRREHSLDPIPCIQLQGNRHITDPQHPSYGHFCGGERKKNVVAKQVVWQTKEAVEQTGRHPWEAFQAAKRQCLQRLGNVPVSQFTLYAFC